MANGARRCRECRGVLGPQEQHKLYCGPCLRTHRRRGEERRNPPTAPVRRCRVCLTGIDHRRRLAIYCSDACRDALMVRLAAGPVGRGKVRRVL